VTAGDTVAALTSSGVVEGGCGMGWKVWSRSVVDAAAPRRRWRGVHRQRLPRPPIAAGLVVVMLLSYAVFTGATAPGAAAVEPPPVPSTPNFGWTQGEFSVSDDGAATYNLPLWVPEGRGRSTPKLALAYNSRAGNGLLGVGWTLSGLSAIGWCPHTFAHDRFSDFAGRFDGTDPLCLDGNRLMPTSPPRLPERSYKTERETYSRITSFGTDDGVPDYFKVWSKDGQILTFGQSNDARLGAFRLKPKPDPANPGQPDFRDPALVLEGTPRVTTAWALNRIEDRNGNAATVEYVWPFDDPTHTDMTPHAIRYAPNREVRFVYQPRTDVIDGYASGVPVRVTQRLIRIEMWGGSSDSPAKLREYRLRYDNNSVSRRSLLVEIKECDADQACKRPLPLSYTLGSNQFQTMAETALAGEATETNTTGDVNGDGRSDLIYPAKAPGENQVDPWVQLAADTPSGLAAPVRSPLGGQRPVDIDADGRTDMMKFVSERSEGADGFRWRLYESNGSGFVERAGSDVGSWTARGDTLFGRDPGYLGDLDGNGLPDFVSHQHSATGQPLNWYLRLNTGAVGAGRFRVRQSTSVPGIPESTGQMVDTNGDGRAEMVYPTVLGDAVFVRQSWGLTAVGGVQRRVENLKNDAPGGSVMFGDLNGDGLDDAVRLRRFQVQQPCCPYRWVLDAQINSGNGFGPVGGPNPPTWTYYLDEGLVNQQYLADFNGDGHDDLLVEPHEFDREGHQEVELYEWRDGGFVRSWTLETKYASVVPLDIDADGVMDLVAGRPAVDGRSRVQIYRHLGGVPDRLFAIGDGVAGPRVEVDYTTLADRTIHTPCTGAAYPLTCLAEGGSVVKQHRVSTFAPAGQEQWDRYDHDYADARSDLNGRGWLGFARHTVVRVSAGVITTTELDNTTRDGGTGSVPAVYPYAHMPKKVSTFIPTGPAGAASRLTTTYDNRIIRLGGGYTVEQRGRVELEEERPPGVNTWRTLRTKSIQTTYDGFGNSDLVVSTTTGGRKHTYNPTFRNDTTRWLIGLPTKAVTTGCDAANRCTTRTSAFDYDDKGNPFLNVVEPDQARLRLTTITEFGEFGIVKSISRSDDAGPVRKATFEFGGTDKLYPTVTTNAMGHQTLIETDPGLGVQTRVTDSNGVVTTMRYDTFGRLRQTNRADGSFERIDHLPTGGRQLTTTTDAGGGVTAVLVDQLNRERERRVRAFDGRMATVYTDYDALGRVSRVSRPALPGETIQYSTYTYDGRARIKTETAPDGAATRYDYIGLESHVRDAKGTESYTVRSVDGDVVSSFEDDPNATAWLVTTIAYDGFGQPTRISAPDDTVQTMHYDTLGRRDQLVDPSSGTTDTGYNAFGEITSHTDGARRTTTTTYDRLGRVASITSPDGTAINTWDTAQFGKGRLASARSADGVTTTYTYNPLSQVATARWTIDGVNYQFDHTYLLGRLATTTYPAIPGAANAGRLTVQQVYNPSGYLSQVRNAAAEGPVYWQIPPDGRNGAGQLTKETFGNGVKTTRAYQPATGLPSSIVTTPPQTSTEGLVDLSLTYDLNRNLTGRTDLANHRAEVYTYDTLNRLRTWRLEGATTTYTYDEVGNLKTETVSGTPDRPDIIFGHGQDNAPPHALTSRNTDRYGYDGAGRQTTGPQRTITYNRAGLPRVIDWGQGQHTEITYGPDDARARKRDAGQTVVYAGGLFERRTPAGTDETEIHNLHNILAEGRVVAQVNRAQAAGGGPITRTAVSYLHTDQQGSTVKVTNPAGQPTGGEGGFLSQLFFDPFGARITATGEPLGHQRHGGPRQGYTGYEHDDEYGLVNANGRIYDPEARRFLTPDPLGADPLSSQALNRYPYVRNNPATLTDPSGLCAADVIIDTCSQVGSGVVNLEDVVDSLTKIASAFTLSEIGMASALLLSTTNGCECVVEGAAPWDDDSGRYDIPTKLVLPPTLTVTTDPGGDGGVPAMPWPGEGDPGPGAAVGVGVGVGVGLAIAVPTLAVALLGSGSGPYVELYEVTTAMMEMRDWAVQQALVDHSFKPMTPQAFGQLVDWYFKEQVSVGIDDGILPKDLVVVPQGHYGPDVWLKLGHTDYVISWDVTTANVQSIVQHDDTYIGTAKTLWGADRRLEVLNVIPLIYPSLKRDP
jgi:RHS repeat-associated protein